MLMNKTWSWPWWPRLELNPAHLAGSPMRSPVGHWATSECQFRSMICFSKGQCWNKTSWAWRPRLELNHAPLDRESVTLICKPRASQLKLGLFEFNDASRKAHGTKSLLVFPSASENATAMQEGQSQNRTLHLHNVRRHTNHSYTGPPPLLLLLLLLRPLWG